MALLQRGWSANLIACQSVALFLPDGDENGKEKGACSGWFHLRIKTMNYR